MFDRRPALGHHLLGAADLAIDFATLGEYGLEAIPADGPRERPGRTTSSSRRAAGWEAFAPARRGACGTGANRSRGAVESRFTLARSSRVDIRAALERYAA
jgi:hypothetical protein